MDSLFPERGRLRHNRHHSERITTPAPNQPRLMHSPPVRRSRRRHHRDARTPGK